MIGTIRKASGSDVTEIKKLIDYWAGKGEILPRSEHNIKSSIGNFIVAEENGAVVATASVVRYTPRLAEIRSVCVHTDYQGKGIGKQIIEFAMAKARSKGIGTVFVLTRKPDFFAKLGFESSTVRTEKIYKDCVNCPLYKKGCDELYMEKRLIR